MRNYDFKICFIFSFIILSGCLSTLLEQKYVRADEGLQIKYVWHGMLFTVPEKRTIHKIRIIGEGSVKNIEVQVRLDEDKWRTIENIKRVITFPYEIHTMVKTDAIRILQKTVRGKGRIKTIKLYSLQKLPT